MKAYDNVNVNLNDNAQQRAEVIDLSMNMHF